MKNKIYNLLVLTAILLLFSGCSKDDEFVDIVPSQINFVKEDGTLLTADDCIDPSKKYNVLIETVAEGSGSFKATKVEYTVNGVSYSMTFMRAGTQINAVNLVNGLNIAQIVESGYVAIINYVVQTDFELVE